jgi:hypothetical protein
MKHLITILAIILAFNTYAQDTIVTTENQRIVASEIVRKNVPTADPSKWVKGMYYTDIKGERVNLKDSDVMKTIMQKLPVNKSNNVVFSRSIQFKNSPKNKIYSKAKIWIADTWKNANEVIQVDNPQGGSILLKGNSTINILLMVNGLKSYEHHLKYTGEFVINENEIQFLFKNITTQHKAIRSQYGLIEGAIERAELYNYYVSIFEMTQTDMEKYANASSDKKVRNVIKKAYRTPKYKKHYLGGVEQISNHLNLLMDSFESKMRELDSEVHIMTSDEALAELKKWKDKYDLELITKEEYDKKKSELAKLIK